MYLQRPYCKQYSDPRSSSQQNRRQLVQYRVTHDNPNNLLRTKKNQERENAPESLSESALGAKTRLIHHRDRITTPARVRVGK